MIITEYYLRDREHNSLFQQVKENANFLKIKCLLTINFAYALKIALGMTQTYKLTA